MSVSLTKSHASYPKAWLESLHLALVVSEWHQEITQALLDDAFDRLVAYGVKKEHIKTYQVAGSFELPMAAAQVLTHKPIDAVICLGCIIKGETDHYHFISQAIINKFLAVGIQEKTPVISGVITAQTPTQAVQRADPKKGARGQEAADAALKMCHLQTLLKK